MGFMVSQRGIEVNPEKIRVIMELEPPKMVKKVQSLNGKIATLTGLSRKQQTNVYPSFAH